jgi:leucyl aminopeptidase (aminopeptidase T)
MLSVGPYEMSTEFTVQKATASDAPEVAEMVGELLAEIMNAIGIQAFNFDLAETTSRLTEILNQEKYVAFVARGASGNPAGFIGLLKRLPDYRTY